MDTRFLQPDTAQLPQPAAAIIAVLGTPQYIEPMWRAATGEAYVVGVVRWCLRPIAVVDFYARKSEPVKGRRVAA